MTGEMNAFLAELYGTGNDVASQAAPDDVEKLAQAEVLDQVLQQEGLTLDQLSGDQILKVAENLFGPDNEIIKMATKHEGESDEEYEARMKKEKEGGGDAETQEEKVAEADFLGRVMAHSFWNEKGTIEKDAAGLYGPTGRLLKEVGKKGAKVLGAKGEAVASGKSAIGRLAGRIAGPAAAKAKRGLSKADLAAQRFGTTVGRQARMKGPLTPGKARALGLGTAGAGAAAAGGAAAAMGGKKKKAALDALAVDRANEILAENGYEFEGEEEKLASAIEERAWELLDEEGFVEDAE